MSVSDLLSVSPAGLRQGVRRGTAVPLARRDVAWAGRASPTTEGDVASRAGQAIAIPARGVRGDGTSPALSPVWRG